MKIVFDLDGTLICSKRRLYELFCDLVKSKQLSFESYWDLKFLGNTNQEILKNEFNYSEDEIKSFVDNWMLNIENDKYLDMDTLIDGVQKLLFEISKDNDLYLCTARQSKHQAFKQLEKLGILHFFKKVFVTEQKKSKKQLLIDSGEVFSNNDYFVGDTGHDVLTGKELGMTTFAVLSGFMSRAKLKFYSPDFIICNITALEI
ncbi:HAD family hydrolase [Acinetobacter guillouiae]|uniref:HAD family hydrolase n=1 Tax=Acinetobacter guillouiae TaxID=106649 RepID=UPI0012506CA8|nr:HAD hydrolase-like protein [Acinetobacter guillouiae]